MMDQLGSPRAAFRKTLRPKMCEITDKTVLGDFKESQDSRFVILRLYLQSFEPLVGTNDIVEKVKTAIQTARAGAACPPPRVLQQNFNPSV
jgi:hypothetical protein